MRQEMESPRAAATAPRVKNADGGTITSTTLDRAKKWRQHKCIVEIDGQRIVISGKELRTLLALVAAGDNGITALEVSSWAFRLAAYCHKLRQLGVPISMSREPHEGGWHGRYRLEGNIKLHPVTTA